MSEIVPAATNVLTEYICGSFPVAAAGLRRVLRLWDGTTYKHTFGFHLILVTCDNTGELLAMKLRPGNAGANTAADHLDVLGEAFTQIPAAHRSMCWCVVTRPLPPTRWSTGSPRRSPRGVGGSVTARPR